MDTWYTLAGFNQPMSSMSHLVGALVVLAMSFFLLGSARRNKCFWYTFCFALSALVLLSLSGVYHMFSPSGQVGQIMIRLDVAAVFLLIVGTFMPIHGILFDGWSRWGVLIPLWVIAITGITLRTIFFDSVPLVVGTGIFLAMGWLGAVTAFLLWKDYGFTALLPVIAGGVCYTIGAIIDVGTRLQVIPWVWGPHETFHLFVLAGLGFHWAFIWQIADGNIQLRSERDESDPDFTPDEFATATS